LHHLLPIFEQTLRISAKKLSEDKAFEKFVKRVGLQALDKGEVWSG
jgi:hypothetical protein